MDVKTIAKPTVFKTIFTIFGIIIEYISLSNCYIIVEKGTSPFCPKILKIISQPFFGFIEQIGDSSQLLMHIVIIIFFGILFYITGMVLEFLYRLIKKQIAEH